MLPLMIHISLHQHSSQGEVEIGHIHYAMDFDVPRIDLHLKSSFFLACVPKHLTPGVVPCKSLVLRLLTCWWQLLFDQQCKTETSKTMLDHWQWVVGKFKFGPNFHGLRCFCFETLRQLIQGICETVCFTHVQTSLAKCVNMSTLDLDFGG